MSERQETAVLGNFTHQLVTAVCVCTGKTKTGNHIPEKRRPYEYNLVSRRGEEGVMF